MYLLVDLRLDSVAMSLEPDRNKQLAVFRYNDDLSGNTP